MCNAHVIVNLSEIATTNGLSFYLLCILFWDAQSWRDDLSKFAQLTAHHHLFIDLGLTHGVDVAIFDEKVLNGSRCDLIGKLEHRHVILFEINEFYFITLHTGCEVCFINSASSLSCQPARLHRKTFFSLCRGIKSRNLPIKSVNECEPARLW